MALQSVTSAYHKITGVKILSVESWKESSQLNTLNKRCICVYMAVGFVCFGIIFKLCIFIIILTYSYCSFIYFQCYVRTFLCNMIHCAVLYIVCVQICTVLLPRGVKPNAFNKIYHFISYHIISNRDIKPRQISPTNYSNSNSVFYTMSIYRIKIAVNKQWLLRIHLILYTLTVTKIKKNKYQNCV